MFRQALKLSLVFALLASFAAGGAAAQEKTFTAEQVAESVVFIYGTRPQLQQIRRNGLERGKVTRVNQEGRPEESSYELRFIRGESSAKDKVRLDQKLPSLEYSLVYNDGKTWGIINGAPFTPRRDATQSFLSQQWHGLDSLLRYKEDGSTITLVGKDKQKGLEFYILDLTDKEKRTTRYYVSTRSLHVLWLEYDDEAGNAGKPVKVRKQFADYRYAQGTLVPYRTIVFEDGKQTQEMRILTVSFGVKMEEALFQSPETPSSSS